MSQIKKLKIAEYFFVIFAVILVASAVEHYFATFETVVRWQNKAITHFKEQTRIHELDKATKVSDTVVPRWVQERPAKVALDVWLATASNICSIIGTLLSILAFIGSRRIRKEKQ